MTLTEEKRKLALLVPSNSSLGEECHPTTSVWWQASRVRTTKRRKTLNRTCCCREREIHCPNALRHRHRRDLCLAFPTPFVSVVVERVVRTDVFTDAKTKINQQIKSPEQSRLRRMLASMVLRELISCFRIRDVNDT